jgi:hypothetical protein
LEWRRSTDNGPCEIKAGETEDDEEEDVPPMPLCAALAEDEERGPLGESSEDCLPALTGMCSFSLDELASLHKSRFVPIL